MLDTIKNKLKTRREEQSEMNFIVESTSVDGMLDEDDLLLETEIDADAVDEETYKKIDAILDGEEDTETDIDQMIDDELDEEE